jgi:hypothetical protein
MSLFETGLTMATISPPRFPIRITEPERFRKGTVFLRDFLKYGPRDVCPRTVCRTVYQISDGFRESDVDFVLVIDFVTAIVEYCDGTRIQIEFVVDGRLVSKHTLQKLEQSMFTDITNLLVVTDGTIATEVREYCDIHHNIDAIQIDDEPDADVGPWKH